MKDQQPPPCNWVVQVFGVKLCGKPSIGMIHKAGYCAEHAEKAVLFFGPMKMIVREELFDEKEKMTTISQASRNP